MKCFVIVSNKFLLIQTHVLMFSNGFLCCGDCFTLWEVGSCLVMGRCPAYSAVWGIPAGNGSSQRTVFNAILLKTVRRESHLENTAHVTKHLGYNMVCWIFVGSVTESCAVARFTKLVPCQQMLNSSISFPSSIGFQW